MMRKMDFFHFDNIINNQHKLLEDPQILIKYNSFYILGLFRY